MLKIEAIRLWNIPDAYADNLQAEIVIGVVDAQRRQIQIVVLVLRVNLCRRTQGVVGFDGLPVPFIGLREQIIKLGFLLALRQVFSRDADGVSVTPALGVGQSQVEGDGEGSG